MSFLNRTLYENSIAVNTIHEQKESWPNGSSSMQILTLIKQHKKINVILGDISVNSHFNVMSPIPCSTLQIVGALYALLFVASLSCNAFVMWMLFSYKHLKTSMNVFVIALTALNLIGSIFQLPVVIVSNLMCT